MKSMDNENHFLKNLELWGRSHPKEALLMPYIDTEGLDFCTTTKGELNLCCQREGRTETFYSQEGALDEAKDWFSTIDSAHAGVLYIYGIGLGYYYKAAAEWLHADKRRVIVFLEDDLRVLSKFLECEMAEELLQDLQVHLFYLKDASAKKEVLDSLYWNVALAKAQATALRYYKQSKSETYIALCHEIAYGSELKKSLVEEYLEYGRGYFMNCYRNLMYLADSYIGSKLYGQFKNYPAIICGAGPSLEKNMHLLKQLKDRALIFAGGSAINILNSASIQPHLCAAIDPNEAQNVRLHHAHIYEVPFFYRNRLGHSAFKTIHGPRLFLTGSGGYDVSAFFESRLNLERDDLDEGRNVVNFSMEIAKKLGCNPIIFVGCDLAFTDSKTYSGGVVFDPNVEQKTLDEYASFETTGLLRKDINGEPIYTLWKWVSESEWIGEWAQQHPNLQLYNCTEGGLGFPNVENIPLKDAAERFMQQQFDISGYLHCAIQNSFTASITQEQVVGALEELKDSLNRCRENLHTLRDETLNVNEKLKNGPLEQPIVQSGLAALAEIELSEESGYRSILSIFNDVYTALLRSDLQQIKHGQGSEEQKQIARNNLVLSRLKFLDDVAKVNTDIMDFAFETYARDSAPASDAPIDEIANAYKAETLEAPLLQWKKQNEEEQETIRLYYDSGELKGETNFNGNLLHGSSIFFNEDGKILAKTFFIEGKPDGECLFYYYSGASYSKQFYSNGLLEGEQIYYYENGQVKTILNYHQGQLINTATLYDKEGNPKRTIHFEPKNGDSNAPQM